MLDSDSSPGFSNSLLDSLPAGDREHVLGACSHADLPFGDTISNPGERISHIYFPTSSYISLITPTGATQSLEVGMVGREGMFGITMLLGVTTSPLLAVVQGAGPSLQMPARAFMGLTRECRAFRRVLDLYLFVLTSQLAQEAACNRYHALDRRMARWLLMTRDRAPADSFRITHQFLAFMLGVRRAGVTEIAGRFQSQGLLRYSRGVLTILDRPALEAVACDCYNQLRTTYRQYLGQSTGKSVDLSRRKIVGPK